MSAPQQTPEVTWAQRSSSSDPERNYIYLTLMTPDISKSNLKLQLTSSSLTFSGYSETKKTNYHVELQFWGEIDVENSKTNHTARDIELILRKKELKEEFWPRLLKDSQKVHFLKTDFDKWVDEDEQDEAPEDEGMGGMGGMPGMGGMGGEGGMNGLDFSKLGAGAGGMGGMGGMPGMEALQGMAGGMGGMPDLGSLGGEGEEGDEGDMPDLEGEEGEDGEQGGEATDSKEDAEPSKAGSKIEEVS